MPRCSVERPELVERRADGAIRENACLLHAAV
jgi:hypothetical protein